MVTDYMPVEQPYDFRRLENALIRLATAIERQTPGPLTQPYGAPQGPPTASAPPTASGPPPAAQKGPDTLKMSKKVFAVCASKGWDIADVGFRATGRQLGADSRKWSFDDLRAVLDKFSEWDK